MSAADDATLEARVDDLYAFAILCSEIYSAALSKLYDKKAADMRYKPDKQPVHIQNLGTNSRAAFEAWRQLYSRKFESDEKRKTTNEKTKGTAL